MATITAAKSSHLKPSPEDAFENGSIWSCLNRRCLRVPSHTPTQGGWEPWLIGAGSQRALASTWDTLWYFVYAAEFPMGLNFLNHILVFLPILLSSLPYRFLLQTAPNKLLPQGALSQALTLRNLTQENEQVHLQGIPITDEHIGLGI